MSCVSNDLHGSAVRVRREPIKTYILLTRIFCRAKINPICAKTSCFPPYGSRSALLQDNLRPAPIGGNCIVNIYYLVIPCHKAPDLSIRTTLLRAETRSARQGLAYIWAHDASTHRSARVAQRGVQKTLSCV